MREIEYEEWRVKMEQYISEQFKVTFKPMANSGAVIEGERYRISFLTSRLIRLEYEENGCFEDHASQAFWYREQEVPALKIKETEDIIEASTEHLRLRYVKNQPFSVDTLSIELKYSCKIWRYGTEEGQNLKGTARTLDEVNGMLQLEKGLMSRDGYVIIDDSKSLVFNESGWLQPRTASGVDCYFFGYGTDFKGCLKDYAKVSGKTPLIPRFALGNWWSRYWRYSDEELLKLMTRFETEEIPLSVCIIDMDWHQVAIDPKYGSGWTGYSWNRDLFKNPTEFLKWLHDHKLKTALNLHPADGIRGHEDCYEDVARFMGVNVEEEQPVQFDISNPKFMKAYFEKVHHPMEADGVDFWWIDWQQGQNSSMKGLDPLFFLNHLHYLDLGRDQSKRGFTFSRWPGLGGHRYPIGFSGDTIVTWESLQYQPYFTATAANVGYGWWSHDIGGHMQGLDDSELYARWVQYGVFSPINRLHTSSGIFNRREPWKHSHEAFKTAKQYLNLRHQLVPYLYSMAWRNEQEGLPLVTPLYYDHPHEQKAYDYKNEYYFGSELLVAPHLTKRSNVTNRSYTEVWLPSGEYFNFFTGEPYKGNNIYPMYGKLEEMPVFAKAGAIIPLAKHDDNSIENPAKMDILIFGKSQNSFNLYEDDGESRQYEQGAYAMTTFAVDAKGNDLTFNILPVAGDVSVLPTQREYCLKFRGVSQEADIVVKINDEIIKAEASYDKVTSTLSVELPNYSYTDVVEVFITSEDLYGYHHDVNEAIIELVQDSTIPMTDKQKFEPYFYGILDENLTINERMIRTLAMPIHEEVKQAVLSILLKAKMDDEK